jgi:RNA polymerase sigma-70 factor (ECF subfamily)
MRSEGPVDADLVIRAQHGDRDAFERLATGSVDRLHAVAWSILGDASLAEDATQGALLSIWRDLPGLRDPARYDAWSYRLVVRACYAERRRAPRWLPNLDGLLEVASRAPDGIAAVDDRDSLERGFRRLPVEQRAVIVLHYVADLHLDKVAEILAIPRGTAHSRLNRALEGLRATLAADARLAGPNVAQREAGK